MWVVDFHKFARDERGAVSSDWVLLSAAVATIALVALNTLKLGTIDAAVSVQTGIQVAARGHGDLTLPTGEVDRSSGCTTRGNSCTIRYTDRAGEEQLLTGTRSNDADGNPTVIDGDGNTLARRNSDGTTTIY